MKFIIRIEQTTISHVDIEVDKPGEFEAEERADEIIKEMDDGSFRPKIPDWRVQLNNYIIASVTEKNPKQ